MKKSVSTFIKVSAALFITASAVACNQSKTGQSSAGPVGPTTVVFVNQDSLVANYNYSKDMRKRLQDKGNAAQSDVGSRQQALQREVAQYQKDRNTMSANEQSMTEQRLQREEQEFQRYQQNAGADFQNAQADETKKLYDKVYAFT